VVEKKVKALWLELAQVENLVVALEALAALLARRRPLQSIT